MNGSGPVDSAGPLPRFRYRSPNVGIGIRHSSPHARATADFSPRSWAAASPIGTAAVPRPRSGRSRSVVLNRSTGLVSPNDPQLMVLHSSAPRLSAGSVTAHRIVLGNLGA